MPSQMGTAYQPILKTNMRKKLAILIIAFIVSVLMGIFVGYTRNVDAQSSGFFFPSGGFLRPVVDTFGIHSTDDIRFDDEILPDGVLCANDDFIQKIGADNWQCVTVSVSADSSQAWEQLFTNPFAITPTTTDTGIYVTASSTIAANFRVDGDSVVTGNASSSGYFVIGTVDPGTDMVAGDLLVGNNATITKDLKVGGHATITGQLSILGRQACIGFTNGCKSKHPFEINNNAQFRGFQMTEADSDTNIAFNFVSDNNSGRIQIAVNNSTRINLQAGADSSFGLDHQVGFHLTNPSDPVGILTDTGGEALAIEENSGDEQWELGVDVDGDLNFQNSGIIQHVFNDNNRVGIATTSPWAVLSVTGNVAFDGLTAISATLDAVCIGDGDELQFNSGVATCTVSSERYKQNIEPYDGGYEAIMNFEPVTFQEIASPNQSKIGLIAEQVAEIDKRFVAYNKEGQPQALQNTAIIAALVDTVQNLQKQIDNLKNYCSI